MTDNHADLIARLEKATEGSREIDIEIDRLIRPRHYEGKATPGVELPAGFGRDPLSLAMHQAPHYTTDMHDVLSLLPDGAEYMISTLYGVAYVELPLNSGVDLPVQVSRKDGNVVLAFVTACLRSRSTEKAE